MSPVEMPVRFDPSPKNTFAFTAPVTYKSDEADSVSSLATPAPERQLSALTDKISPASAFTLTSVSASEPLTLRMPPRCPPPIAT